MFNNLENKITVNQLKNNNRKFIYNQNKEYQSGVLGDFVRSGDSDNLVRGNGISGGHLLEESSNSNKSKAGGANIHVLSKILSHIADSKGKGRSGGSKSANGPYLLNIEGAGRKKKPGRPKGSKNCKCLGGALGNVRNLSDPIQSNDGLVGGNDASYDAAMATSGSIISAPLPRVRGRRLKGKGVIDDAMKWVGKNVLGPIASKVFKPYASDKLKELKSQTGYGKNRTKVWDTIDQAIKGKGLSGGDSIGTKNFVNNQSREDSLRGAGNKKSNLSKVQEIRKRDKCSLKDAWATFKNEQI